MTIAKHIEAIRRQEVDLRQRVIAAGTHRVAQAAGISPKSVSAWAHGRREASAEWLARVESGLARAEKNSASQG